MLFCFGLFIQKRNYELTGFRNDIDGSPAVRPKGSETVIFIQIKTFSFIFSLYKFLPEDSLSEVKWVQFM